MTATLNWIYREDMGEHVAQTDTHEYAARKALSGTNERLWIWRALCRPRADKHWFALTPEGIPEQLDIGGLVTADYARAAAEKHAMLQAAPNPIPDVIFSLLPPGLMLAELHEHIALHGYHLVSYGPHGGRTASIMDPRNNLVAVESVPDQEGAAQALLERVVQAAGAPSGQSAANRLAEAIQHLTSTPPAPSKAIASLQGAMAALGLQTLSTRENHGDAARRAGLEDPHPERE